jgi:hypothetical protein
MTMTTAPLRPRRRARSSLLAALASALVLLAALLLAPSVGAARVSSKPRAHASSYLVGIGDEHPAMFSDPLYRQLHTKIARLIVAYDVVAHPYFLNQAYTWIHDAEAQHVQVLVAFYHSEYSATRMPSVALYQHDVQKFLKLFPTVKQYQSWDEANRGNVARAFSSPSAPLAARYYQALLRVCKGCTVLGLDVLDAANIGPTLEYIHEFKREIGRLRTVMPKYWGLHNYSDVNRFESWRTRELAEALGGQVWLTETGGIVQFGPSFLNRHGSGLARAAQALKYMFSLASGSSRVKRLYIFDWTGGVTSTRFDAGLMDSRYKPRPGYVVVCRQLHAARCAVHTSKR